MVRLSSRRRSIRQPSEECSMNLRLASLASAVLLVGAALAAPTATAVDRGGHAPHAAKHYRNAVLDQDFPDPDVIQAADGWYYAYGTEGDPGGQHVNIQTARSRDLVHWHYLGDAMPSLPSWGDQAVVSWAPEVVHHQGRYYLYYSTVPNDRLEDFGLCLAVATSRSPAGPFTTTDQPLYCGPTYADIDADVFHDPATGAWQVYWGSGGDIVTARLDRSLTRLAAPDEEPTLLLRGWSSTVPRPFEHGIEGPFVIARRGWYYLFYSGDNCCSYPPHYATMVARSRSATGPFHRFRSSTPRGSSVILHSNRRWAGPGHNSVIRDRAGHDWIVYHAIDRQQPYLPGSDENVRRVMLLDRITYRHGWPRIAHDSPSIAPQRAPVTR
jgi:arabinan endo-1,5-alpha-L-arabinosidase